MALRDALVKFEEDTPPDDYLNAVIAKAREIGGEIRLSVGPAFSLGDGAVKGGVGVSLWVDKAAWGKSPSWQRVSTTIVSSDYVSVLTMFAKAFDGIPINEPADV